MHNRARMVVASFLTQGPADRLAARREVVRCSELVDGDPANNNGGWQWAGIDGHRRRSRTSGSSTPSAQGERFDPQGLYVRRHVPQLRRVPAAKIHEPWTMTAEEQRESGCRIGVDYPAPIVDHAKEKESALSMFAAIRK